MYALYPSRKFVSIAITGLILAGCGAKQEPEQVVQQPQSHPTLHKTVNVGGLDIFYREAGAKDAATILLLHGFPTSSHMFRNLMPALSDQFHLVAPDFPGFGNSAQPPMEEFEYAFDHLAEITEQFTEAA